MKKKPLACHFGVAVADVGAVVDAVGRLRVGRPRVAGDGWNTWCEAPGADVNDLETRHVCVNVASLSEFLVLCEALTGWLVVAQDQVLAVATDRADWEVVWLVMRQTSALTLAVR